MPDNIPTITVRPGDKPDGKGDPIAKGAKLSRQQIAGLIREEMPGLSPAGVEGVVRNVFRESGGDPNAYNPDYSGGFFQHHNSRFDDLKKFAKDQGTDWSDPRTQVRFAAKELKSNYPTLLAQLQKGDDPAEAEDAFKRVFERPASIMWQNNPRLASDRYRYSDYALDEHKDRKNTDLVYMKPQDLLDLSPDLQGQPWESPSGQSLKRSVDRGDEIEAVPTLDMTVRGKTGLVTAQDGRHRALMAQDEGVDSIPVAIRKTGGDKKGEPTEIQGMSGMVVPNDFPKAKDKPKRSILQRAGDVMFPRAEAAEPAKPEGNWWEEPNEKKADKPEPQPPEKPAEGNWWEEPEHDNMAVSALKGAAAGFGKTVLGGQELIGKGLEAASDLISPPQQTLQGLAAGEAPKRTGMVGRAGEWLVDDARKGVTNLDKETKADREAHPYATGAGEIAGGMAIPGGGEFAAGRIGLGMIGRAAVGGGLSGLLEPGKEGDDEHYWRDKALQTTGGAAGGVAVGGGANMLASLIGKRLRPAVERLMTEGVEMTPGQVAGGALKRGEDAMASVPILGAEIRKAQQRSFETFNRAAINRSLADINSELPKGIVSGHDAIAEAERQLRAAYNSVIPSMRGIRDPAFMGDLNHIITRAHAQGTPTELPQEYIDRLRYTIQREIVDRFDANGHISGDLAQDVGTRLDGIIRPMIASDNPYTQNVGRALREADKALDNMMAAHNPALQAAKDRIDAGWAKFKTVQRASVAAGAAPDGTFTPAQLSRSVLARDRSKDKAAFAKGDAMMQDLAAAAREVLPQKVPDSGTPERAAFMAAVGLGGHFISPWSALALGAAAVPYTAPFSKAANAIINKLGPASRQTRNALADLTRIGGQVAAPAAGQQSGQFAQDRIPTMTVHPQ